MKRKNMRIWNALLSILGLALVGAAILDQLRRPPENRTWQGTIFGIPYDFSIPTIERIREEIWNKDTNRILMPHSFGMGWGINFYPLFYPKAQ